MEDEFELQFADELDALDDFDPDSVCAPLAKGKKSLNFSTPSTKVKNLVLHDNEPFHERGTESTDDSFCCEPLNKTVEETPTSQEKAKRKRSKDEFSELSDDDEKDKDSTEVLPDIVQPLKRQRISEGKQPIVCPESISFPFQNDDILKNKEPLLHMGKERIQNCGDFLMSDDNFERERVLTRMPSRDYVPVTDNTGRRFYMGLKEEDDESCPDELDNIKYGKKPSQLLSVPVADLKMKLEDKRCQVLLQESRKLSQCVDSSENVYSDDGSTNFEKEIEKHDHKEYLTARKLATALWVDRYSPNRYTELLSDEATNRVVLKWLKLWDVLVFGKEKKVKDPTENKKNNQKFVPFNKNQQELTEELDQHNRPNYKAVLLSGPPGLGKTTLAHVISKHAGYNVVEINASDDRSAEIFKQKLEAATQMKAVLGADPRPNCLIIDEIDGAPVAAVNVLLSLLKQTEGQTTSKKKKKQQILLRPIICICNDLYVPALRQLRQNSLVVNFPPTLSTHLAGRLMEICRKENLQSDLTTLLALCEKADNDIRSCLNTLQFIKGKSGELLLHAVNSMSLGQKDAHKSLFSTWQHIFKLPKAKRKNYVNPHERSSENQPDLDMAVGQNNTSLSARFDSALQVTIAAGESEKVLQGLFENYLDAKVKDPRLYSVVQATEWLEFVDMVNKQILHNQNYTLMRYTSYLPVTFHLLFAANNPHRILYPHSQYENVIKLQKSENLIATLVNDVCPAVRKNLNVVVTVTEFLQPLLEIIQPTLRPVNTQLYSGREKEELSHLIQVMIAYNMSYRQERTPDGQYTYVLDPNIDDLVKYPDMKSKKQLTYAAKQLISREIEVEKMRRSEGREEQNRQISEQRQSKLQSKGKVNQNDNKSEETAKTPLPNYKRQKLEAKSVEDEKEYMDFFGRKIKRTTPEAKREQKKEEAIGGEIWFKFKEGFSNAVRRTVKVQDFL